MSRCIMGLYRPVLRCVTSLLGPLVIVYIMWAPGTSKISVKFLCWRWCRLLAGQTLAVSPKNFHYGVSSPLTQKRRDAERPRPISFAEVSCSGAGLQPPWLGARCRSLIPPPRCSSEPAGVQLESTDACCSWQRLRVGHPRRKKLHMPGISVTKDGLRFRTSESRNTPGRTLSSGWRRHLRPLSGCKDTAQLDNFTG